MVSHPGLSHSCLVSRWSAVVAACLVLTLFPASPVAAKGGNNGKGKNRAQPSRSTNIALTRRGDKLIATNLEANSVSIFRVRAHPRDIEIQKLDEIPVGSEPHSLAIHPNDFTAYVTNTVSGTVSVIPLNGRRPNSVTKEIAVGTEPRGCALTPSGRLLYVANHTAGTVSVIDTRSNSVVDTIPLGGNPTAVAITNDGDGQDVDETVFVTQFYAELIPNGPGEGFDDGKQAIVHAFLVGDPNTRTRITLSPLAESGFTADRSKFCKQLNVDAANDTFCPDTEETDPLSQTIAADPQAVHPNQLYSSLIRDDRLYLPNIGAQPEPPVQFRVNVQALVHVVDTDALSEVAAEHVNLNAQIAKEPSPANPLASLGRLFGNDVVAIDADSTGTDFLIVSRGGNYVLRAGIGEDGKLDIGAPNDVIRFKTGNTPTGVVMSRDGKRAYVNNDVGHSITVIDLESNEVLEQDVPSSSPPEPGTHAHAVLVGKLVFFTALGVPDNGLIGTPIRDIDPLLSRGKQSDNAWSTCASCHPSGLADGITWIFPDGPRQTIPLDGLYSKINGAHDTRINNWSAARDSVTDFNGNSRAVQGGVGFASDPPFSAAQPNPAVFDHGISQGASEALDFETLWAQTVRAPILPKAEDPGQAAAGGEVFASQCASCHGGAKWTKSQILYANNPTLDKAAAAGGTPRDPGLTFVQNQSVSYADLKLDTGSLKFLDDAGTFDAAGAIEIRGAGAAIGRGSLGGLGFNVPSLLGVSYHAPFFHNGSAETLEQVFDAHKLGAGTIASTVNDPADRDALLTFLRALDARTATFASDADTFKNPTQNLP
jgi:YVTN family beta-propeller protein